MHIENQKFKDFASKSYNFEVISIISQFFSQNFCKVPEEAAPLIHQMEGALAEYQKQMPQDVYQGASMLKNVLNNSSQRLADREGSYGNNSRGNMIGMNSFSDNV